MYYCNIKKSDIADGPGVRVTLFVSGCTHHCEECFQPETWNFTYGQPFTKEVEEELMEALRPGYVAGLTLLGGEPFEPQNQARLLPFVKRVREAFPKKTIWCYTGYLFDTELLGEHPVHTKDTLPLLQQIDVLVDGVFLEAKKNLNIRFRGSENQRIIDVPHSLATGHPVLLNMDTERS